MSSGDPYEHLETAATSDGVPVAPEMGTLLERARVPVERTLIDRRTVFISALAVAIALVTGFVARLLVAIIDLVTNAAFFGRISILPVSPAAHRLGWLVVFIPVLGGLVIGVMARYGSAAIRGHGIPEAMEQVLTNESRIPARITFLKPLSAAISIGTGGPFGAEGPIIATGGAIGSVTGQILEITAMERKTLLAAGAAAGMAATFGSPVSAVLLAIELLLFELRPRSIIVVALAAVTATAVRVGFVGYQPAFAMPSIARPENRRSRRMSCSARSSGCSPCTRRAPSTGSKICSNICRCTGCGGRRSEASPSARSATSCPPRWASATPTSKT